MERKIGMKKSIKRTLLGILLFVTVLTIPSFTWTKSNVKNIETFYNSRLSPIIMIPGSSATEDRFDSLVDKLNMNRQEDKHSLLKVKVWNNGRITYSGSISPNDNEPVIVVGFENNNDGYGNIKKQASMFNSAFNDLQNKFCFNNFKGLGHSNGGLIYTAFIEKYLGNYDVELKRLMTIGTPYNFSETNINNKSQMLADFIANRGNIPTGMSMYSVAGTITYDSDELVPDSSVSAGKYIYQGQVAHYTETTVTGEDAQHSDLPTNDEVVSIIQQRIEDPQDRNDKRRR